MLKQSKQPKQPKQPGHSSGETRLLTPKDMAEFLGVPTSTLAAWRVSGCGPVFVRMGRVIRYRKSDLEKFIEDSTLEATNGRRPNNPEYDKFKTL